MRQGEEQSFTFRGLRVEGRAVPATYRGLLGIRIEDCSTFCYLPGNPLAWGRRRATRQLPSFSLLVGASELGLCSSY